MYPKLMRPPQPLDAGSVDPLVQVEEQREQHARLDQDDHGRQAPARVLQLAVARLVEPVTAVAALADRAVVHEALEHARLRARARLERGGFGLAHRASALERAREHAARVG